MIPCGHDPIRPETCKTCLLAATKPKYARHWGVGLPDRAPQPPPKRFALPKCSYLGEPTGDTRLCPTCTGKVEVKLMGCEKHGACSESKLITGIACCRICPDYRRAPSVP